MKIDIAYESFRLRHTVNLEEYLKIHYNLTFTDNKCDQMSDLQIVRDGIDENTWQNLAAGEKKNSNGLFLYKGAILEWEAINQDVSIVEALPLVKSKSSQLQSYKTQYLLNLEKILKWTIIIFTKNGTIESIKFLESYKLQRSDLSEFKIGCPVDFDLLRTLLKSLTFSKEEINYLLNDLFVPIRGGDRKYLSDKPSLFVPVYDNDGIFLGFAGYLLNNSQSQTPFSTGHLQKAQARILFGYQIKAIAEAIHDKRQVVFTGGLIDQFSAFVHDFHHTLSTLTGRVSEDQVKQLKELNIDSMIIALDNPGERDIILSRSRDALKNVNLKVIETETPLSKSAAKGESIRKLVDSAVQKMVLNQEAQRLSNIRRYRNLLDYLTQNGKTVIIPRDKLRQSLNCYEKRKLVAELLKSKSQARIINSKYIRIPESFLTDEVADNLGSAIKTLLFLYDKTNPKTLSVNYTLVNLEKDLGISRSLLFSHIKLLEESGYLRKKKIKKTQFFFFPSLLKL
jgi:hypothetical protein